MNEDAEGFGGIKAEEIRSACAAVIGSREFSKAYRMRRLLSYLVAATLEGHVREINEYSIGVEVFDRNPADCMTEDPIVRVQIGRLRKRLSAYYLKHSLRDGVKIDIPVGQHVPVFRRRPCPTGRGAQAAFGCLGIRPLRHISATRAGEAFACGLYEELVNQLFVRFGDICVPVAEMAGDAAEAPFWADGRVMAGPCCLVEGSVRVDDERIRTSIRVVNVPLRRILWAGHFDRPSLPGIRGQEDLAACICRALKDVVPMPGSDGHADPVPVM
ncbi:MAG TPA: hypothetical protein VF271_10035 [Rhodanobacteraceae bacterium]